MTTYCLGLYVYSTLLLYDDITCWMIAGIFLVIFNRYCIPRSGLLSESWQLLAYRRGQLNRICNFQSQSRAEIELCICGYTNILLLLSQALFGCVQYNTYSANVYEKVSLYRKNEKTKQQKKCEKFVFRKSLFLGKIENSLFVNINFRENIKVSLFAKIGFLAEILKFDFVAKI